MSDQTPTTPDPTPAPTSASVPAPPPARPARPAPPVASSAEYFNSSRLKVIGTILAGSLVVGALGAIAGVAFDPSPAKRSPIVQPGGDGGTVAPKGGSFGDSALRSPSHLISGGRQPGALITISPSPAPSASTSGGTFPSQSPSESPSESPSPSPSPSPTPGGDTGTGTGGSAETIQSSGVQVYIPDGWKVYSEDGASVYMNDDHGSYALAATVNVDPSTAASDLLQENLDALLPPDSYTQRQTTDISALDPFGSVVSLAEVDYQALWVDNQGSSTIEGQIYSGVRQDGTALVVLIEHLPAEDFETAFNVEKDIVNNTFGAFGATSG